MIEEASKPFVSKMMDEEHNCRPVFLTEELAEAFDTNFCCKVLWPMFHSVQTDLGSGLLEHFQAAFDAYSAVNSLFLEELAEECVTFGPLRVVLRPCHLLTPPASASPFHS